MTGHIRPLPAGLDQLVGGRRELTSWPLAELAAAGVALSAGAENRPELGTDPVGIAEATARLSAAGLIAGSSSAPFDPRHAELELLAHGYSGAPGGMAATLTTDLGADGAGSDVVFLSLFPAQTATGALAIGNLLIDPQRASALAALTSVQAAAAAITAHVVEHGQPADDVLEFGSLDLLTIRPRSVGGAKSTLYSIHLYKSSNTFDVNVQHSLRVTEVGSFTRPQFEAWLIDLMQKTFAE